MTSIEICAGAGGQALGLHDARFKHLALVEIDKHCCQTLRQRKAWSGRVFEQDLHDFERTFDFHKLRGRVDLLAGGLPCPPFSVAGKQLGRDDERNLFPVALNIIQKLMPRAIMIENVRGFLDAVFEDFRVEIRTKLQALGYRVDWKLLNASDFGVPQLRPRVVIVAMRESAWPHFRWPATSRNEPMTVGDVLYPLMTEAGWKGASKWRKAANEIAPTIVGGSKKHGGPDLGPTRARKAWASLGVNGIKLADAPPPRDFVGMPHLTVPMVALLQGFPPEWKFSGGKTAAYRQVGNAFPPPVAAAVARAIRRALAKDKGQERLGIDDVA